MKLAVIQELTTTDAAQPAVLPRDFLRAGNVGLPRLLTAATFSRPPADPRALPLLWLFL
jgi:hypothetical protein